MRILIRTMDGKVKSVKVNDAISVEIFRVIVHAQFPNIPVVGQRLYYGGKVLEDGHALHEYGIDSNDMITLIGKL